MANEAIEMSAKNLGAAVLPNMCPRCLWIKYKMQNRVPFEIFPAIFSQIDSYTKKHVEEHLRIHGKFPPAIDNLIPHLNTSLPVPTYKTFCSSFRGTNLVLRGTPDAVYLRRDEKVVIVDYKTAHFKADDPLLPMYKIQLNVYGFLWQAIYDRPLAGLKLIYTDPLTDADAAGLDENTTPSGFKLGFDAHILNVEMDLESVFWACKIAEGILSKEKCPEGREGCPNCQKVNRMVEVAKAVASYEREQEHCTPPLA